MKSLFCYPVCFTLIMHFLTIQGFGQATSLFDLEALYQMYESAEYQNVIDILEDVIKDDKFEAFDCSDRGIIENILAKSYYNLNKEEKAIIHFKNVLYKVWKSCHDVSQEEILNLYFNIGVSHQFLGNAYLGKSYIDTCLILMDTIKNYPDDQKFFKYQGAASLYSEIRDVTKAESFFNSAIIYSASVSGIDAYYLKIEMLSVYLKHKKYNKAKRLLQEIEKTYIQPSHDELQNIDKGIYYLNAAEFATKTKDYIYGEKFALKALDLTKEDNYLNSNAHEILGVIYYDTKSFIKSLHHYELAYSLRSDDNILLAEISQSFALENMCELHLANGEYEDALHHVDKAMALIASEIPKDSFGNPYQVHLASNGYYLIRQLVLKYRVIQEAFARDVNKAFTLSTPIIDKVDTLRNQILKNAYLDQSKLDLLADFNLPYGQFVNTFYTKYKISNNKEYLVKILEQSSNSKGTLINNYHQISQSLFALSQSELYSKYSSLKNKLADIKNAQSTKPTNDHNLDESYANIQVQLEFCENQLLEKYAPTYSKLPFEETVTSLSKQLDKNDVILDIFTDSAYHYMICLTRHDTHIFTLDAKPTDSLLTYLKESLTDPSKKYDLVKGNLLYKSTIAQISNLTGIKNISNLYVAPHGAWNNFPLETLVKEDGKFLVTTCNIGYTFNINFLKNDISSHDFTYDYVGFGTTYTDELHQRLSKDLNIDKSQSLGRLYFAEKEILNASEKIGGKLYLDTAANIYNFRKIDGHSKILHLSLHGIADLEDGGQGALVFDNRHSQYLLHVFELIKNPIAADLVILSACNSASGSLEMGEGINSLSRSFLTGNVSHLVSSIWQASEGSAIQIIPMFVRSFINSESPIEALGKAKSKYLEAAPPSLSHPYYWANFIIYPKVYSKPSYDFYLYYGIPLLLLLLLGVWLYSKRQN